MIDLLVAGGGPAGLATALHGARAGLRVCVIERRRGPIDKACGEGLMPAAVRHLERLGVPAAGHDFRGIRYLDGDRCVDAPFRSGTGRGVRRTTLHAALLDAAQTAGVEFVHDEIGAVAQDSVSASANGIRARYLAAADGLHSPIRQSLGLAVPSGAPRRWGIRRHVEIPPWSEYVEVHWAPGAEAYVTPVGDDRVGIAILTTHRAGFDDQLAAFPALRRRVHDRSHGPDRAAGPLRQRVRRRTVGRVLLVGDAAGYVDALTGEGLGLSFSAAELLVGCVVRDRPDQYEHQWTAMSRRYRMLTAALLWAAGRPPVRSRIVPAAVKFPKVFNVLVDRMAE